MFELDAKPKLPKILRNAFWQDFIDVITVELNTLKHRIEEKEIFFDIDQIEDREQLLEIARSLGYIPDLTIDDSLENIRDNVNSITFRIRNKSSFVSYQYLFKTVPYPGQLYIMYNADTKLVRAAEQLFNIIGRLEELPQYNIPFMYPAEENYSQFLFSTLYLDMGLLLDSPSQPWSLDVFTSSAATKHIAVEYSIDKIITRDAEEFLMVPDYVDYLFNGVDYTRKLVEVPHVGCHLSFIIDESGFYDSYSEGADDYTVPVLKTRAAVTDLYVPEDPAAEKIHRMVVGSGTQSMVSVTGGGTHPTELANQFSFSELIEDETQQIIVDYSGWKVIESYIQANTVKGEFIADGDGSILSTNNFLGYTGIKPFSLRIPFRSLTLNTAIVDNGQEELFVEGFTDYPIGTINYETGFYDFTTEKREDVILEVISLLEQEDNFTTNLSEGRIIPGTLTLRFRVGGTGIVKFDNGVGGFTDYTTGIDAGTINYANGSIDVNFINPTDARDPETEGQGNIDGGITVTYSFIREFPVNDEQALLATYTVEENIPITEAGLEDDEGNLIAYATFPPIVMADARYHASFQWFIKAGLFNNY